MSTPEAFISRSWSAHCEAGARVKWYSPMTGSQGLPSFSRYWLLAASVSPLGEVAAPSFRWPAVGTGAAARASSLRRVSAPAAGPSAASSSAALSERMRFMFF